MLLSLIPKHLLHFAGPTLSSTYWLRGALQCLVISDDQGALALTPTNACWPSSLALIHVTLLRCILDRYHLCPCLCLVCACKRPAVLVSVFSLNANANIACGLLKVYHHTQHCLCLSSLGRAPSGHVLPCCHSLRSADTTCCEY